MSLVAGYAGAFRCAMIQLPTAVTMPNPTENQKTINGLLCRQVPGFPKYYVSDTGIVFSFWRKQIKILKTHFDKKGYEVATLCNAKENKSFRIHRVVALAFLDNPGNHPCVRHLDGNPKNNHVDNLAWGSYSDNEQDKLVHGTWENRRNGKLTKEMRRKAFELKRKYWTDQKIASLFGVSRPTITRLINRKTWFGV